MNRVTIRLVSPFAIVFASLACSASVKSEYTAALGAGDLAAYQAFLQKHPTGKWAEMIRDRMRRERAEEFYGIPAKQQNPAARAQAYRNFIDKYPDAPETGLARSTADSIESGIDYKEATKTNTSSAYQAFLQKHPNSPDARMAQVQLDGRIQVESWEAAVAARSVEALEAHLRAYPNSGRTDEALARIAALKAAKVEDGAWNEAERRNTRASWDDYIARYSTRDARCNEALMKRDALVGKTPTATPGGERAVTLRGKLSVKYVLNFFGDGTGVTADGELSVPMIPDGYLLAANCRSYVVRGPATVKIGKVVGRTREGGGIIEVDTAAIYRVTGTLLGETLEATAITREP